MAYLFDKEKVTKFFSILNRFDGGIPIDLTKYVWKDYVTIYTKASNHVPCTREVFVHRTINKWFKGKYLVIYRVSDLGITYKQYISITSLAYYNDWGNGYIKAYFADYVKPFDSTIFQGEKIKHNIALNLEGQWCENGDIHNQLLSLVSMEDIPDKEYVFQAYDWNKYPKRKKRGIDPVNLIKTTKSFIAKTTCQAYELKKAYEKNPDINKIDIGELLEVKLV